MDKQQMYVISTICAVALFLLGLLSGYLLFSPPAVTDTPAHYIDAGTRGHVDVRLNTDLDTYTTNDDTAAFDGRCNTEVLNTCLSGTFIDYEDSDGLYRWGCLGNGGVNEGCGIPMVPDDR